MFIIRQVNSNFLYESCSGISGVIDLTWGGWIKGKRAAIEMGLPYIRVQGAENHPFVQAADDFLESQVSYAKVKPTFFDIYFKFHRIICLKESIKPTWAQH